MSRLEILKSKFKLFIKKKMLTIFLAVFKLADLIEIIENNLFFVFISKIS